MTITKKIENFMKNPIIVKQSDLKNPDGFTSPYIKQCPNCEKGLLTTRRGENLELIEEDFCAHCGTKFIYSDFQKMKEGETI